MMHTRSSFDYEMTSSVVAITDNDRGGTSVTNDIENVVRVISHLHDIDPVKYRWIYRDSEGDWDGWNPTTDNFIPLGTRIKEVAIRMISEMEVLH